MATGDKKITQLGRAASTAKQGVFAIVDPITDKTVQLAVQAALGAIRANMDWQSDTTYAIAPICLLSIVFPFLNFLNCICTMSPLSITQPQIF